MIETLYSKYFGPISIVILTVMLYTCTFMTVYR